MLRETKATSLGLHGVIYIIMACKHNEIRSMNQKIRYSDLLIGRGHACNATADVSSEM